MNKIIILAFLVTGNLHARVNVSKFKLGQSLFFDKIISGNKNISCATCHHPLTGSTDWLSLGVGEGGRGLAITRSLGKGKNKIHERVPRNAPHLFNLSDHYTTVLFHDGRVERNDKYPSGVKSPAGMDLPEGLDSVLAAQALFPPTSNTEMAGQGSENQIAINTTAGRIFGENSVWSVITERVANNKKYAEMFVKSFKDVRSASDIKEVHIANALAHYESKAFFTMNSPFDKFSRGQKDAMSESAKKGYELFKGKANCISCHSGQNFTDNKFYSIALPQIGQGKGHGKHGEEDFGREGVTGDRKDRYKFRVPGLRNIALTAPYGHNGAYSSLKDIVKHHLDPKGMMTSYSISKSRMRKRSDLSAHDQRALTPEIKHEILASKDIEQITLSRNEINQLLDFLNALTDEKFLDASNLIPRKVFSGLPIYE